VIHVRAHDIILLHVNTGVASDHGWSKTRSVPRVGALSVKTCPVGRAKERRLPREGGVKLKEGMPETGSFISTVRR
jgi:hypothetical protein